LERYSAWVEDAVFECGFVSFFCGIFLAGYVGLLLMDIVTATIVFFACWIGPPLIIKFLGTLFRPKYNPYKNKKLPFENALSRVRVELARLEEESKKLEEKSKKIDLEVFGDEYSLRRLKMESYTIEEFIEELREGIERAKEINERLKRMQEKG
jgi:TM2 domain-containing membrane protein YozV